MQSRDLKKRTATPTPSTTMISGPCARRWLQKAIFSVIENENLRAKCWSQASRGAANCKLAVYDTDCPVIDNVLMTQCKELSRKY